MLEFVPEWPVIATFTIACIVLYITPGPDMSLFLAKTISGGKRDGMAAFLGASTGSLVHTFLAAVGISALLQVSATAFFVLKICGAVYLLWMAFDVIRSGSTFKVETSKVSGEPFWKVYLLGLGINLTNPKIVLFFVTFLPQFVVANDPAASAKLLFFGLYFIAFTLPCGIATIMVADRLVALIRSKPRIIRVIDWVFASVFCLFAIKILTAERN